MKAKFEEFNDGIADVYHVNDEDRLEMIKKGLRFGNENVGITRHYAAQAADTRVDRVIHILRRQAIAKITLGKFEKHREREFA